MLKIKFREEETATPLQAICPWVDFITNDLVLNKDGSLMAAFEYRGIDPDNLFDERIDTATELIQKAYAQLDERIMAWWIVDKRVDDSYPEGEFTNQTAETIDRIYSTQFTSAKRYSIRYHLYLLYTGETGSNKFIDRIARIQSESGKSIVAAAMAAVKESMSGRAAFALENGMLKENIHTFERIIAGFVSIAPLRLKRLERDDYTNALSTLLNRASPPANSRKPKGAMLDSWLPNNYISTGPDIIRFKGNTNTVYAGVLGMVKWPEHTSPLLFESIIRMDLELTICQVVRFLGQDASTKEITKAIEYYELTQYPLVAHAIAKASNQVATPKPGMAQLLNQSKESLEKIGVLGVTYAYHNTSVFVYGDSKQDLTRKIALVSQKIAHTHFVAIRERQNTLPSFAAMLPGQWSQQCRYDLVSIENVADISPIYTMDEGKSEHEHFSKMVFNKPVPAFTTFGNSYGGRTYFSPHVGQVGHMLIVAPTGGGKTTFVNFASSQFQRYGRVNTFIFDRNLSCKATTLLHGGSHVDIATSGGKFNPFFTMKNGSPDGRTWVREWILHRLAEGGFNATAEDRNVLDEKLAIVADEPELRLSTLAAMLPRRISDELTEWLEDGPYGMFDSDEDSFSLANWTTVEMRQIMSNERLARGFMEYAFRKIYESLDGTPTLIYLEEASFLLNNPQFKDALDDWLKTFRKKEAFIWMTIQSPSSITSSDVAASLLDNIFSFLFCFNEKVESHRESYKRNFAMEDYQVDQIANLKKNREYLLVQNQSSRVLQTSFTPEVLAYLRSEQACINLLDKLIASGDDNWQQKYLEMAAKM